MLNKYFNHNIKINDFFIDIESWSTFVKLLGKSTLKKTILSRMWRNFAFPCDWGFFFWLFALFVCLKFFSVCVVPSSTAWTFASDVKTLLFPGLSIRSISSGAMYQNNSSIRQFHSRFHSARYAIARIFCPLRYHCQYENIFFRYYWFCNSLLIKSSQIH